MVTPPSSSRSDVIQILVTAPVAIGAAIQYFTTINAPYPAK
ncbi:hypothetical protein [Nocardia gipuzkoensis]|jgi:hypothetical protein